MVSEIRNTRQHCKFCRVKQGMVSGIYLPIYLTSVPSYRFWELILASGRIMHGIIRRADDVQLEVLREQSLLRHGFANRPYCSRFKHSPTHKLFFGQACRRADDR